jgi:hypothetical protein
MTAKPDCFRWYSIKSTISFSSSVIRIDFVIITPPVNVYEKFSTECTGKQYLHFAQSEDNWLKSSSEGKRGVLLIRLKYA